jgi:hypothetical protein
VLFGELVPPALLFDHLIAFNITKDIPFQKSTELARRHYDHPGITARSQEGTLWA